MSSLPNPSCLITVSTTRSWYGVRAGVSKPFSNCSIELPRHMPSSLPSAWSTRRTSCANPGTSFA